MPMNRRRFLKHSVSSLAGAGLFGAFGNLRALAAAANQYAFPAGDFKALVCVYLNGGNDSFNSIVPYSSSQYADYRSREWN